VAALPRLGLGISTEFGASAHGLDALALRRDRPDLLQFLEIGVDLERGADDAARAWVRTGAPTTYHFLDLNLEESDDLDAAWIAAARDLARELGAAWLCGDAGLWHVGPRDRGHGVLLPPVLTAASASALARNVRQLREAAELEVLPENPPAHVYAGDLHILDYFARVADAADSGLLLDVAHLAIYQRATGRAPLDGLDGFPLERVVEVHIAGGTEFEHVGRRFVDDDHVPEPLADTWRILEAVLPRATNLRAVVYECERNTRAQVLPNFEKLRAQLDGPRRSPAARYAGSGGLRRPIEIETGTRVRSVQRSLVRMQHDAGFAAQVARGDAEAIASAQLDATGTAWLRALDPVAVAADRDGKRAAQLVRNVTSEFRLCAAIGPAGDGDAWTHAFSRSVFFHAAIARDTSLPLAFAAFAEAHAAEGATPLFAALVALEAAMARARREIAVAPSPAPGTLRLSSAAHLVDVPAGTFAAAVQLGEKPDRGALPAVASAQRESILIVADLAADARFGRLRPLRVEPLADLVAAFLQRAQESLDAAACAAFAREHDVADADLAAVVADYVADGVLLRGDGEP
jgi:uncharacterized protein (UPF0276 family)